MEWKEVRLGNVCEIYGRIGFRGYTTNDLVDTPKEGAISLSPKNIINGELNLEQCTYIKWDKYYESPEIMINPNEIVITKTGSSVGRTTFVRRVVHPMTLNPQLVVLKNISENAEFLSYYIKSALFQSVLKSIVVGSAIPTLSQKNLANLMINVPKEVEDQRRIASILSSLDRKIELNNKINAGLEEMAQAIFKNWFVDFEPFKDGKFVDSELGMIPEGWKVTQIADISHILETGKRPKGGAVKKGIPSVGAEHVKGMCAYDYSKTKYINCEFAAKLKTGKINGYELMIYKDGGKPGYFIPNFSIFGEGYPFENCYLNEHVFKLDFDGNKEFNIFCYFFFKTEQIMSYFNAQGAKAAIPGINKKDVENIYIFSPDNESVIKFGEFAYPLFKQMLKNAIENRALSLLRDTLLPRLMSGEIEVPQ